MSKGLGHLQRQIRDYLAETPVATTYETLRWELFERRNDTKGLENRFHLHNGYLPAAWNTSLKRALDGLAKSDENRVSVQKRNLASIEEFVANYPGKTLASETRRLRIELLPALANLISSDEQSPRYSLSENEDFHFNNLEKDILRETLTLWLDLEPDLIHHLDHLSGEPRNDLFILIARAKSLLEDAPLKCSRSIDQSIKRLNAKSALTPSLIKRVSIFSNALLPSSQIGFLQLKSWVRSFVEIPSSGSDYRLKPHTLDFLDAKCPNVVRSLPGYEPAPEMKTRGKLVAFDSFFGEKPRAKHGEKIHSLIDKNVFSKFYFVNINR